MIKKIACLVLSFVMCISLFCVVLGVTVIGYLGNYNSWIDCANKTELFLTAEKKLEKELSTFSVPSGIPSYVFEEVISEDMIKSDLTEQFEFVSSGKKYSFDRDNLKKIFIDAFEKYALDIGYEMSEEADEGISELAELCIEAYSDYITTPIFTLIVGYIFDYTESIKVVIVVASGIFIMALCVLCVYKKKKSLSFISYAINGSALLCAIPAVFVYIVKVFEMFYFEPIYMYKLFVETINGSVDLLLYVSFALLLVGVAFAVADILVIRKDNNSEKLSGEKQ